MAAIDKIYVNSFEQYEEFRDWCKKQPSLKDKYGREVKITQYLYFWRKEDLSDRKYSDFPIFNAPCYVDAYVIRNCPFDYIQRGLMLNYGHKTEEDIKEMFEAVKGRTPEEQKRINEAKANNVYPNPISNYWWVDLDDFDIAEDGKISLKKKEKSTYEKILEGELYNSPKRSGIEFGTHFTMIKSPTAWGYNKFEKPLRGTWFIDVESPTGKYDFLWFHQTSKKNFGSGTWDYVDEFVDDPYGSSSSANIPTIRSLRRRIKEWKLPIGTRIIATGRYEYERYEFIVRK